MAETDISHEFGREPGFSSLVFVVFGPEGSHMLHLYKKGERKYQHQTDFIINMGNTNFHLNGKMAQKLVEFLHKSMEKVVQVQHKLILKYFPLVGRGGAKRSKGVCW